MTDTTLTNAIKEKYGKAAVGARTSSCCGGRCDDPITSNLYDASQTGALPAEAVNASLGCGNPTALIELSRGPDRARPRIGRRHRRPALRQARRPDRQGLRARHDRRDAGARAREPAEGRRDQRRVSQGRDRAHSAARQLGGRRDLELRHQPVRGQGPGVARSVPRAQARRPLRGLRCRRARRRSRPTSGATSSCGSAASPARSRSRSTDRSSPPPASPTWTSSPWRVYDLNDAREFLAGTGIDVDAIAPQAEGRFASAFIRARKAETTSCCGPECCA